MGFLGFSYKPRERLNEAIQKRDFKEIWRFVTVIAGTTMEESERQQHIHRGLAVMKEIAASTSIEIKATNIEKALVKQLKSKDRFVRSTIADILDRTGWKPSSDSDKSLYLIGKEQWSELEKTGQSAVKPLISLLHTDDLDTRLNIVGTLGEIGDERVGEQISYIVDPRLYPPAFYPSHLWERKHDYYWTYYGIMVPVLAEALSKIGRRHIEWIIRFPKEQALFAGVPVVWALAEIGDARSIETIIAWIFRVGQVSGLGESFEKPMSRPAFIRSFLPKSILSRLLGDYADLILDIFAWEPITDSAKVDVTTCDAAIQQLCSIKTAVSSNILHKVAQTYSIIVSIRGSTASFETTSFNFESQRLIAVEELKHRGNPRYDPSVYLKPDA